MLRPNKWLVSLVFVTGIAAGNAIEEGKAEFEARNYVAAHAILRPFAEAGNPKAQGILALMYSAGWGVKIDFSEALKWARLGAEKGDAASQYTLGLAHLEGRAGLKKDESLAIDFFRKSAAQKYASAQYNLGRVYEHGWGVFKDEQEAVSWYRKAANQNYAAAQYSLGRALANGKGAPKNLPEAIRLSQLALANPNATEETKHLATRALSDLGLAAVLGIATATEVSVVTPKAQQGKFASAPPGSRGASEEPVNKILQLAEGPLTNDFGKNISLEQAKSQAKAVADAKTKEQERLAAEKKERESQLQTSNSPSALTVSGPEFAALRQQFEALRAQVSGPLPTAISLAPQAPKLTARALVIGNSAYTSFSVLPNPRNDASDFAALLRSFGVQVDLVLDADRDTLIRALNDYSSHASGRDVNILFYAGHGVQVEGNNYLVPTNMRADGISAGYVKLAGISLNAALDYLPAKTRLVFLDACRDNPAAKSLIASRSAGAVGLAPVVTTTGTLIAYATKDGATAEDGNGRNSPYTAALLKHLHIPQDIGIVLRMVRQSVMSMTSNRQEPWEYGSLVGGQLVLSTMAR